MRIAIVTPNQQIVGGAETYLRWLLPELASRAHELFLAFEYGAPESSAAIDRSLDVAGRHVMDAGARDRTLLKLKEFAPDVVFLQGINDSRLETELAQQFNCIFFAHAFHGTCLTGTRRNTRVRLGPCERQFGPACMVANYVLGCGARRPDGVVRAFLEQSVREESARAFRSIVVASGYMKTVFERQGVNGDKIHVISYPTLGTQPDVNPPQPRSSTGKLLFVGRITAVKSLDHAVRAIHFVRQSRGLDLTLCIAGEGPKLEESLRLAKELGVKVEPHGWVDGGKKLELMRAADLLILPSTWPEPFGIVGIEAGCVGLPSVGYGIGGTTEWLRAGVSGEVASPGPLRPEALGRAIEKALASDEHLHELRLGAWRVAKEFTGARHLDALQCLFRSTLATPN